MPLTVCLDNNRARPVRKEATQQALLWSDNGNTRVEVGTKPDGSVIITIKRDDTHEWRMIEIPPEPIFGEPTDMTLPTIITIDRRDNVHVQGRHTVEELRFRNPCNPKQPQSAS